MTTPRTLLAMAGADLTPNRLSKSVVVLIDCQNEYVTGALPLHGVEDALREIAALLAAARAAGAPVIHVVHKGAAGGPFDPAGPGGAIAPPAAALPGEAVVSKTLPNAFTAPEFGAVLQETGRQRLIVAGFQTHMCVSATVRAGLDHGYRNTVIASACATRDLPSVAGGVLAATDLHVAALTALSDRFAVIAATTAELLP
ncbi:MAG: isochorismatase family protein [Rhodospirillaceae bacterium]